MQTSAPDGKGTLPSTTLNASMDEQQALSPLSPASTEPGAGTIDPLVAKTAKKIADVINDFKRELEQRDGSRAHTQGSLELALKVEQSTKTFKLTIAPGKDGDKCPITVQTILKKPEVIIVDNDTTTTTPWIFKSMQYVSGAELKRDDIPHKKRKLDEGEDEANKCPRTNEEGNGNGGDGNDDDNDDDDDDDDTVSLINKDDLDDLLVELQKDIQEETDTISHVQRLLRRFKGEWRKKSKLDFEQSQKKQSEACACDSASAVGSGPGGPFSPSDIEGGNVNDSVADIVRREAGLILRQIKQAEDCRRIANDVHIKREDTWRTSSAGFHDQQRQNRENFQNQMVHESAMHSQILNQILNEVKAIGLYAQHMKWETPSYLNHMPSMSPQIPAPPAFPAQPSPPAFFTQPAQPKRSPPSEPNQPDQPNQRQRFTWKKERGSGSQNG